MRCVSDGIEAHTHITQHAKRDVSDFYQHALVSGINSYPYSNSTSADPYIVNGSISLRCMHIADQYGSVGPLRLQGSTKKV